jgi:hypothetical protein
LKHSIWFGKRARQKSGWTKSRIYLDGFLYLGGTDPMREFLTPDCTACRIGRIVGVTIGGLALLILIAAFVLTH